MTVFVDHAGGVTWRISGRLATWRADRAATSISRKPYAPEVRQMAVYVKSLDRPEATESYGAEGDAEAVQIGDSVVWRSRLKPGWSWEHNAKPKTGMDFCQSHHHEYVVAGRIRYHLRDGSTVEAAAGDHVVIEPGHAAEVVGDEICVLIDW
jgi:hypothetical protein